MTPDEILTAIAGGLVGGFLAMAAGVLLLAASRWWNR